MMASTSNAEGVLPCSADAVPILIMDGYMSNRTDEARVDPKLVQSIKEIPSDLLQFRAFTTAVVEHVTARLAQKNLCLDNAESKKRSLLLFVNWPLLAHEEGPRALGPSVNMRYSGGCRISSPWIDLVIRRKPVPWIYAMVRWNERQFLADQAVLAGAKMPLGPNVATPLTQLESSFFVGEYQITEIGPRKRPTVKPIEERVPPDLLWLLRRSRQMNISNEIPSSFIEEIESSMHHLTNKSAENYTRLVNVLIDRCFASDDRAYFGYDSILDAADLIPLEQYKIDMPLMR
jgi:hypothetical protein